MLRERRQSSLSEAARDLRNATRIMALLAFLMLGGAFAAHKGWLLRTLLPGFVGLFVAATLTAVWIGIKARGKALEDRERESRGAMIIAIAVQLGKQDDASLQAIKAKGGPAGEAAGMILQGRAEKAMKVKAKQ